MFLFPVSDTTGQQTLNIASDVLPQAVYNRSNLQVWLLGMMCFSAANGYKERKCFLEKVGAIMKRKGLEFGKHQRYHRVSFSGLDFFEVEKIFMLERSVTKHTQSRCSVSSSARKTATVIEIYGS